MLVAMQKHFTLAFIASPVPWPRMRIISGFRTEKRNREVGGAPDSRHIRCPSQAADLQIGNAQGISTPELWQILGGWWELHGGRWGGRFNPIDPNHFDLG